ncbi:hypothetical protein HAX54_019756, partial [Datura stramonium]|nr:hypothetical protein [Datura stramonium]
ESVVGGPCDDSEATASQVLMDKAKLLGENDRLHQENEEIQVHLAHNEKIATDRHNDLMNLIRKLSPLSIASSSIASQSSPSAPAP